MLEDLAEEGFSGEWQKSLKPTPQQFMYNLLRRESR
jgi:hypothetical protein